MNSSFLKNAVFDELLDNDDIINALCESSTNSEEEDVCITACAVLLEAAVGRKRNTIKNYCEEVVKSYTAKEFARHFRVTQLLFHDLVLKFQASEIYKKLIHSHNWGTTITVEKHLLIFLWFAGHQTSSFRDVADRFDVSLSSLYDVITHVMMFFSSMSNEVITFSSVHEKCETKTFYIRKKSFPNVVGSVDGSHFRIDRPSDRPTDYFNRKDYHSIILQGVCNEKLKFIDVYVGYPGSVHDAQVIRNSALCAKLNEFCSGDEYILGDSAYPLLTKLLTTYRHNGHLTAIQKKCNYRLSSCLVSIEHAFGLLKQRFRQIYHLKLKGPEQLCNFIRACCVLRNLCIGDNLSFESEGEIDDQPQLIMCEEAVNRDAKKLRDNVSKERYYSKICFYP